jgi:5-formyltetrahydrofolate cyclo-ligase
MTKKDIRREMIQKRNEVSKDILNKQTNHIIKQITDDYDYQTSKMIAIFHPMGSEVNLLSLMKDKTKTFCIPKVEGEHIHFYVYDTHLSFKRSAFGVLEPEGGLCVDDEIEYMLAPALAISHDLYRVGYGKGFYDRFLKLHRPKKVMGVIYDFQEFLTIPHDSYDEKLDGYFKGHL